MSFRISSSGRPKTSLRDAGLIALAVVAFTVSLVVKLALSVASALWTTGVVWGAAFVYGFVFAPDDLAKRSRRQRWLAGIIGLAFVGVVIAVGWSGVRDRQVAGELRRDGVEVPAEIVDALSRSREAKVVFETASGHAVEIWVPVSIHVERGPTLVHYLPRNPELARLVADPTPRSTDLPALLIFAAFCGLVAVALMVGFRGIDRSLGLRDR